MQWFTQKRGIIEVIFALALLFLSVYLWFKIPKPREIMYDCRLSEISPDFPPQVREECRKLRATYF